jgi:secretion/DNA translocation related TadE-like protein
VKGRDEGYATLWVVTAMALVVVAAGVAVGYGIATVARHRAAAAADAAGLTVALWAVDGAATACAKGAETARLNGGVETRCIVDGAVAQVGVTVALPGLLAAWGPATGRARAGPVSMSELSAGP